MYKLLTEPYQGSVMLTLKLSNWVARIPKIRPWAWIRTLPQACSLGRLSSSNADEQLKKNWFHKTLRRVSSHHWALGALWSSSLKGSFDPPPPPQWSSWPFFVCSVLVGGGREIGGGWGDLRGQVEFFPLLVGLRIWIINVFWSNHASFTI